MGDRPAVAETGHRRAAGMLPDGPGSRLRGHPETVTAPRDLRIQPPDQAGRDGRPVQRENDLDQAGHARGALQVPDVPFDRTDQTGFARSPARTVDHTERLGLLRITEPGPGAVCLHQVHGRRVDPGVRARTAHHVFLSRSRGRHDAVGATVLVHAAARDDREHPVTGTPCVGQSAQHEDTATFPATVPVGVGVERSRPAVRRQRTRLGQRQRLPRRHDQIDSRGQSGGAVPRAQALACQVQRDQRRRTRGVHRQARAAQVEHVRDAVGQCAVRRSDPRPRLDAGQVLQETSPVVSGAEAHVDPGFTAAQRVRRYPRVFQGLPTGLQQYPLLRIHLLGLAPGHPEERGVEPLDVVEETAPGDGALHRQIVLRAHLAVPLPAPHGRGSGRLPLPGQQIPEGLRAFRSTGETASDSDDRDGFGRPAHGRSPAVAHAGISRISTTAAASMTPGPLPNISTWSPGRSAPVRSR